MRLDKLQLDLRPRPNAQALDLGFALLRSHASHVYLAWLALWLPLVALCGGLAWLVPDYAGVWLMLAWWLKPLLERAPLYVLSRQVFGESVTWQDAVRAWPRQLGGGWFRMLTWWRPFVPSRGLYQAIWQLEGARGAVAAERRKVIAQNKTARSAYWFGIVCAHFEVILQVGLIAFIGIFLSNESSVNPFAYLIDGGTTNSPLMMAMTFVGYALAGGIIGPIYIACCFTLYLNRRATLEAWDIEIVLRQIKPPAVRRMPVGTAIALILPTLLALTLIHAPPAEAAKASPATQTCAAPEWLQERRESQAELRSADQNAAQTRLRQEVADLFDTDDLRGYVCEEVWRFKNPAEEDTPKAEDTDLPDLAWLADVIRILLIAGAIALVAWLLYRYRDKFPRFAAKPVFTKATEIGGLDIRPETLPDDVAAAVRRLWEAGQQRAALALLYRATLSRLVDQDGLRLTQGATEGDCLRLATEAHAKRRLNDVKLDIVTAATNLWLSGAYGNRWPNTDTVVAHCAQWQAHFGNAVTSKAVQQ